jgi:hypothetical protein
MPVSAIGWRPAATDRMGEAAAHAARAAVRGSVAGYHHPTVARLGRRHDLLRLSPDRGHSFGADRLGLCAIRRQHYRVDKLHCGARCRRAIGDEFKVRGKQGIRADANPTLVGRTGRAGFAAQRAIGIRASPAFRGGVKRKINRRDAAHVSLSHQGQARQAPQCPGASR